MTAGRTNHRLFAAGRREHVRLVHVNCQRPYCPICDGGLFVCTVCGQAEGELEHECPGDRANPPHPAPARFITRSDCSSCSIYANECPGPREDHCPITGEPQCP